MTFPVFGGISGSTRTMRNTDDPLRVFATGRSRQHPDLDPARARVLEDARDLPRGARGRHDVVNDRERAPGDLAAPPRLDRERAGDVAGARERRQGELVYRLAQAQHERWVGVDSEQPRDAARDLPRLVVAGRAQ